MAVIEVLPGARRHFGHLRLGIVPGFLGRVADQRGDPQPELQRRVRPAEGLGQRLEPLDPLGDAVQRLAPEELRIGLGGRDLLRRSRGAAEVEARVAAILGSPGRGLTVDPSTEKYRPWKVTPSPVHSRRTICMNSLVLA